MTKSGIAPKQGDIVLIPVPFTDLTSFKRRPVLVISNSTYNRRAPDIIVVAITSNPDTRNGVVVTQKSLASGQLPVTSFVRPGNIYTLSKKIIVKHIGSVHPAVLDSVVERVIGLFGKKVLRG